MSFHDLPKNWHALPLTDTALARDVVDLVVRDQDREGGCIVILLCDEDHRMVQPVAITDIGDRARPGEAANLFDMVLDQVGDQVGGLVVAIGRPHGHVPDDEARTWHEAAIARCRRHGVPLVGTYLATDRGVMEMPRWEELPATG